MKTLSGKLVKILLVWMLVLLTLFTAFPNNLVRATPKTVVKVEPHASYTHVGETFNINITVVNVRNLYGVDITLQWNASILKLVEADVRLGRSDGVLYGQIFSPYGENKSICGEGVCRIACVSVAPAPSFNGSGTVARLTFNVTNVGRCKLSLASKLASNLKIHGSAAPIEHTTVDGFFVPIEITASPKIVTVGEKVNVSGFIAPAQADVSVTIWYMVDEENIWSKLVTVKSDVHGNYVYLWLPEKSGKYFLKSTAIILGNEETSLIISVSVNKAEQIPWLYIYIFILAIIIVGAVALLFIYRRRTRR